MIILIMVMMVVWRDYDDEEEEEEEDVTECPKSMNLPSLVPSSVLNNQLCICAWRLPEVPVLNS